MVFKYVPNRRGIGESSVEAAVDPIMEKAAQQIMDRAKQIAQSEGMAAYADALRVDEGTRPKGRGYRRVIADTGDATALEHGDTGKARLRILGRAAGIQIFPDVPR